ncbi:hypothetical protein L915_00771 [Phytophthora nicotianae]|uniref:Armadillo repeat-containing domain-containing protein n=1 Tax=Phytophthora nicotianae TaxID=4792 RepID=W2HMN8_PHYNI|nr:hypothetical protein L915_00771 [Phytophthora nicotianae]
MTVTPISTITMPLATSTNAPPALTSKPRAPSRPGSASATVAKRRWNAPPAGLFPTASTTSKKNERPSTANAKHLPDVSTARTTPQDPRQQFRAAMATAPSISGRRTNIRKESSNSRKIDENQKTRQEMGIVASPPLGRRLSQPSRLHCGSDGLQHTAKVDVIEPHDRVSDGSAPVALRADSKRQQLLAREAELNAMQSERRRDSFHSAQVLKSLRRQDVEADDVSPLIEIIYWSPFVEVRRDAAAAIASLCRNTANLDLLDEVGALGAILTMLSSPLDREDPGISIDCAQALAALVRLSTVKTKLLQAPGGIDCVFSLLHTTTDQKLRLAGFEIVARLVTTDEWREAVAKREGFAFMLKCCSGSGAPQTSRGAAGDTRTRTLAASVLHQLAVSCDNRVFFYHSGHFTTLAGLLRDPFLDKDAVFRRELLNFVHLLLSETENARRFASIGLLSCVLSVLGRGSSCSTRPSLQVSLLVVAILDEVVKDDVNHEALVQAEAMTRLVHLCFSFNGIPIAETEAKRPHTAAISTQAKTSSRPFSATSTRPRSVSTWPASEATAIIRATLGIFCAMARNIANREHVIRSKVLDHIAARELYASSDKRVRRAVINLLTLLICSKSKQHKHPNQLEDDTSSSPPASPRVSSQTSESDYQHYIELLARGVVKCLFGILAGDDFGMKVDALSALAQLTHDAPSRLTLCKPALLAALGQFAFHPLVSTRLHVAQIIANFAERPENVLKLVDAGLLPVLVRYVSPLDRNHAVGHSSDKGVSEALLIETTRALAAVSELHVARSRLVESGVLGALMRLIRVSSNRSEVRSYAQSAVRNLRHDAAALRIQAIYRGWHVRMTFTGVKRRQNIRKLSMLVEAAIPMQQR